MPKRCPPNIGYRTRGAVRKRRLIAKLTEEQRLARNERQRQFMAEARVKQQAERLAAAREGGQRPLSPASMRRRAQRNARERLRKAKRKREREEQRQAELQVKTSVLKTDSYKPQRYSQNDIGCDDVIVKEEDWCKDLEYDDKLLDTKLQYINESSARCGTVEPIISQDKKPFACTLCNTKYRYQGSYARHMLSHTDKATNKCALCPKQNNWMSKLKHSEEKAFTCTLCNKKYKFKGHYKRHMLSHTDQVTYKCALCPKQYNWISQLRIHVVKHSDEKPFSCSGCDKQFKYKHKFKRHVLSHTVHGIYNCEVCDKQYNWITLLRYHMLKHTNENPFTCAVCKEQFIYNGNYKIHVASHSK